MVKDRCEEDFVKLEDIEPLDTEKLFAPLKDMSGVLNAIKGDLQEARNKLLSEEEEQPSEEDVEDGDGVLYACELFSKHPCLREGFDELNEQLDDAQSKAEHYMKLLKDAEAVIVRQRTLINKLVALNTREKKDCLDSV